MINTNIKERLKVVHFISSLSMGGAETLVKDYALGFDKSKIDLTIICLYRKGTPYEKILEEHGINVIYLTDELPITPGKVKIKQHGYFLKRSVNYIAGCILIRKYIRKIKPNILHYHLTLNKYIWLARPKKPISIFYTVHSEPNKIWFNGNISQKFDFQCVKWLIKKYDMQLIALHDDMRVELNKMFKVEDTIVVNNGIDFSHFKVEVNKQTIRNKVGISQDAFVIGNVGRFYEPKNHMFLIDVFNAIHECNPKAHLLLVGDGPLKKNVENKIQKMNLKGNVTILGNRIDIPELMSIMDRFVFPSLYEGLGIVLVEAQKMHLPCIISDTVPDHAILTNLVIKKSLKAPISEWADEIINFEIKNNKIEDNLLEQWDMKKICRQLEDIYAENCR